MDPARWKGEVTALRNCYVHIRDFYTAEQCSYSKDPGLGKTKTRSTAEGENRTWFVVINRPEAVLKGILLRPQKGVKGTFMVHDEVNFKVRVSVQLRTKFSHNVTFCPL